MARRVSTAAPLLLAVGLVLFSVSGLRAQWVEAPGKGWVQLSLYHQDTDEQFGPGGDRQPITNQGESVATVLFVTAAGGIAPGVDAWVQLPLQRLDFSDAAGERTRSGIGDGSLFLRVAPGRYLGFDAPVAVRAGVKVPMADFNVDSEVISLSDGQTDWELMLEAGHSFHPTPLYVSGWVGYRWREANRTIRRDFGDQAFFLAQVGGEAGPVGYRVILEGWEGQDPVIEGIRLHSAEREMLQVTPTLTYGVGPGSVEAGARYPMAGRNLLSGWTLVLGYFTPWSLF